MSLAWGEGVWLPEQPGVGAGAVQPQMDSVWSNSTCIAGSYHPLVAGMKTFHSLTLFILAVSPESLGNLYSAA